MFDYIVVGAGYAGAVMAERIATQLNQKILIIDKRKHIGGNCFDRKDENNILIHQYGPHLFHTDNRTVVSYLSQFTDWDPYHHEVLAFVDGKKVPVPFNLNSLYELFPQSLASSLEAAMLKSYALNTKVPILELKQSDDPQLQFLAEYIYEKIFVNYTAKQWGLKPEEMDGAVTARVPVFVGRDNRYFNDTYQMVPRHGYTRLFEKMLDHPNIKILLNTDFREVAEIHGSTFHLFGREFGGKIIYTGALDALFNYRFGELPYRSVEMQFETVSQSRYQEKGTVNYPNDYDFTRITEFKHIHPSNSERTTILKEFPLPYVRNENTPYYPIFTPENQRNYERYVSHAATFENLILLGRLAEYRYYDMDDIVARALELFETEFTA